MKQKSIALLSCLFIFFLSAPSFGKGPPIEVKQDSVSWKARLWREFSSPITTNARYIVGGSLLSSGMVYFSKGRRQYQKRESFKEAQPFGEFGFIGEVMGWGFLNGIYTVANFWYGMSDNKSENLRAGEHMLKASFYSLFVTSGLKVLIKEKRPGYPEDRASFPSGHSSMSFAFASVVAARHGWIYGSLAHGAATYISVSRINDDWHYLHDVLFGIGIGAGYGWGLHYLFENELPYQFGMAPIPGGGAFNISWNF